MPEAKAIARYVRVSPQKARLVVDLIRGLRAEDAVNHLRFTRKRIALNVAKLLQSA
ncbi:MAG TPA: uL22 family ribosomal protein, partial [Terriglobales bacterium]|nr:uL22 family ribosomal protein [Terriglobales bacterium]